MFGSMACVARGALMWTILSVVTATAADAEQVLRIGVREDARPFSHLSDQGQPGVDTPRPGLPRSHGFTGYVVAICEAALEAGQRNRRSGFPAEMGFETVVVNAQNRFDALLDGRIDILCDPATITPRRLTDLMVSMPIYLSAVTYAEPREFPGELPCQNIVGVVSETTADMTGLRSIIAAGSWPRFGGRVSAALDQIGPEGNAGPRVLPDDPECGAEVIRYYGNHTDLARDFCAAETLFYVGDVEILQRQIRVREGCEARSRILPAVFTNERYAIYARRTSETPETAAAILTFMGELSELVYRRPSLLLNEFAEHFDRGTASEKLRAFYWGLLGDFPR